MNHQSMGWIATVIAKSKEDCFNTLYNYLVVNEYWDIDILEENMKLINKFIEEAYILTIVEEVESQVVNCLFT